MNYFKVSGYARCAMLAAAVCGAMGVEAKGAAVTWATDASGLWTTAANWSSSPVLPGSGDDVTIDRGAANPVVTLSSGTQVIGTLVDNEALTITGGTLDVVGTTGSGTMTVGATLTMSGGTLKDATLSFVSGGSLAGTGVNFSNVTLASDLSLGSSITSTNGLALAGTTLTMNSSLGNGQSLTFTGNQTLGGTGTVLTNHGSGGGGDLITGSGTLTVGSGVAIKTGTGAASISMQNILNQGLISAEVSGNGITFTGTTLTNSGGGTIQAINGDTFSIGGTTFTNQGTLTENGATVTITTPKWSNTGTMNVTGGTLNLGGNITWANIGTIVRSGGTINLTGTLDNTGQTLALTAATGNFGLSGTIKNGNISFAGGSTLNVANGTFDGVTLENDLTLSQSLTILDGLTLTGSPNPTISLNGNNGTSVSLAFGGTADVLSGTGTITSIHTSGGGGGFITGTTGTISPGITIKTATGSITFSFTTLTNQGAISAESAAAMSIGGTTMTNAACGTIQAINGDTLTINPTTFTNAGTLTENASTVTISSGTWSNTGTINVTGGTLNLGGNITWANIGTIVRSGGTINITGNLTNTAQTLALTAATGSFGLSGTIKGGNISFADGATLNIANGTFDGVTLENDLTVQNATLNVLDGLTLTGSPNPTITLLAFNGNNAAMSFNGTTAQILGGTGSILLNHTTGGGQAFFSGGAPTTIGSQITIKTGTGSGTFSMTTLINQGLISSEVSGNSLTIGGTTFTNSSTGTVRAINGGTAVISASSWSNAGNLIVNGSTLTLSNIWSNTGTISVTNATLNLGGNFTLASSGTIVRSGTTTVNITGVLDNTGQTLAISPTTTGGSLGLSGTIKNGNVSFAGGSTLNVANGTLDGVTLQNDLTVQNATLNVLDGLTLTGSPNPTITLLAFNGNNAAMSFNGTTAQMLGGTGTIVSNHTTGGGQASFSGSAPTTIESGMTIKTGTGNVAFSMTTLTNQGIISSETAGLGISFNSNFTNTGMLRSRNGGTFTFAGNVTITGTGILDAAGGAIAQSAGTLLIGTAGNTAGTITGAATTSLTVNASSDLTSDGVKVASWTINGVDTIRPNGTAANVSKTSTLAIGGTTGAWTGELALNNNKLIVEDTTNHATTLATIKDQVNFGNSHAAGIVIVPTLTTQTEVVSDNAIGKLTSFAGQVVDAGSIIVTSTYKGDANLDGVVNIADLNVVAAHWQQSVTDWSQGDFNGDGIVNIADLNVVAANWQAGAGSGSSLDEALGATPALATQSVPEPGALGIMVLGGVAVLRKKRG